MIELGKIQVLEAVRTAPHGVYLKETEEEGGREVLLPNNQLPEDLEIGDMLEVFIYKDSDDRMIATMTRPYLTLGEVGTLRVVDTAGIGAFLYWGLEKDLFLPYKEQKRSLKKGDEIRVILYLDKTGRLCASMNIYERLSNDSPYEKHNMVKGTIYQINPKIGYFVAVDDCYHGLILNKEVYKQLYVGDTIEARVIQVRPDGKLELGLRPSAKDQIEGDAQKILSSLSKHNGKLAFNDNSSPESIKAEFAMSKKAFKRAVGRLLKEGAIKITTDGIESTWK